MLGTQIDTSYLVGLIITLICMIMFSAAGLAIWLFDFADTGRGVSFWWGAGTWLGGWALCIGGFVAFAFPPLPGQYNEYRPVTGIVKQVGSRFIASGVQGGGTSQRFAVQFTNGSTYGCDDSRCSTLKPGQGVTLLCERDFQFNAYEGWVCNFGKYGVNHV